MICTPYRKQGTREMNGANVAYADFRGVKGLTIRQVKNANNWLLGLYPSDILKQLGLNSNHNSTSLNNTEKAVNA